MAVKRIAKQPTARDRAIEDRVMRAKKSYPRIDRHGVYMQSCSELARELGADVVAMYSEFEDRVSALLYTAEYDVEDAEAQAMRDVEERFRLAS